jgi:5-methylcytosine-specific restriction endonuclease McrA
MFRLDHTATDHLAVAGVPAPARARATPAAVLEEFLRDDGGTPLGRGYPSGRPSRRDGERHYDAWLRMLRADPCAYCGGPGGTVDHVEPRSRPARGIGSVHGWVNTVGACGPCNGRKSDRTLLLWLARRR